MFFLFISLTNWGKQNNFHSMFRIRVFCVTIPFSSIPMREKKIEKQGKEGFRNRTTKINAVRFASGIEISFTVF